MARDKTRYSVAVGDKRLVYFGQWDHPAGKYSNFRTMFDNARSAVTDFEKAQRDILADENLSEKGRAKAIDKAVQDFDALHQRWMRGPVADRRPAVEKQLRELRGGRPREKDDVAGQLADQEMRAWFRGLGPDERTKIIGAMKRGELGEVSAALLRMPDQMTGLRPELRDELEAVSVDSHNLDKVIELRAELAAIDQAIEALETSKSEVLRMAESEGVAPTIQARDALEAEGLQKVEGESKVEPFVAPEVDPFETDGDGVIDLKATRAKDLAKEPSAA